MKEDPKRKNRGNRGRALVWITQNHRQCHRSIQCMRLLETMQPSSINLYCFRDTASYFVESRIFPTQHVFDASVGGDCIGISRSLACKKSRVAGYIVRRCVIEAPSVVGYGEGCPLPRLLGGQGSVVSFPSSGANPGRKRIVAYFETHRTLLFAPTVYTEI